MDFMTDSYDSFKKDAHLKSGLNIYAPVLRLIIQ